MRPLTTAELLQVWEDGTHQTLCRRALLLLAASAVDDAALLPIGQRDACLMRLRQWMFGSHIIGVTACAACREQLELNFTLDDIRVAGSEAQLGAGDYVFHEGGCQVRFRVPNSLDMMALEQAFPGSARYVLLERCVLSVTRRLKPRQARPMRRSRRASQPPRARHTPLTPELAASVASHMAAADPQADVRLAMVCSACGHAWDATFDIALFFWNEIHTWALRTLRDVHTLAAVYGWSERAILDLSPWRRQIYLEMAR